MSREVADTLRKALDVLRERGLAKYALEDDEGHVCARGALFCALTGTPNPWDVGFWRGPMHDAWNPADDLLGEVATEQWSDRTSVDVVAFNNHPYTTQDDVERAFEKAIARAEEMAL